MAFTEITPVTGNLDALKAVLCKMPNLQIVQREGYLHGSYNRGMVDKLYCGTPSPQIEAVFAEANAERARETDPRVRDRILCAAQRTATSMGLRDYTIMTNIYGYCVGCTMLSNLGGRRFALTHRGATLAECFGFVVANTQEPGSSFTHTLSDLPVEVQDLVRAEVARRMS